MDDFVVRRHSHASEFLERAQGFLARHEAENVLLLGVVLSVSRAEHLLTVERGPDCAMAGFRSGSNLILSRGPASAVGALVERLIADNASLPGVIGPVAAAGRFSDLWRARTAHETRLHMNMRVHELTEVVLPRRPSGALRRAALSDVEPLAAWADDLNVAVRTVDPPPGEASVRKRIGQGRMYVWDNGGPVSMAACDGPTPRGMRINFVYTPPEHRGRGYASACVADLSQLLLDEGRQFCALFTDLANPVSNRIYARLGYRPVCDFDDYVFVD